MAPNNPLEQSEKQLVLPADVIDIANQCITEYTEGYDEVAFNPLVAAGYQEILAEQPAAEPEQRVNENLNGRAPTVTELQRAAKMTAGHNQIISVEDAGIGLKAS